MNGSTPCINILQKDDASIDLSDKKYLGHFQMAYFDFPYHFNIYRVFDATPCINENGSMRPLKLGIRTKQKKIFVSGK